ncbi:MAG: hypothetical protein JW993_10265 [Sedimentisphaerales bacterium]|nr:hypothetical protein [Sedimentisphaerales bacterium]
MSQLSEALKGVKLTVILNILELIVANLSEPVRNGLVDAITKLEQTAATTPSKADDILAVLLHPIKEWLAD